MPIFVIKVERDERMQQAISRSIAAFEEELLREWDVLCHKNGGPPPPPKKLVLSQPSRELTRDPIDNMP
jgi:hypothetical protein